MGFFDNDKKSFGFEKRDDLESHNNKDMNAMLFCKICGALQDVMI